MKSKDFQALLLRAAVVAMAADGEIAESEKQELAQVANSTAYFLGFDHSKLLPDLLADEDNTSADAVARLVEAVAQAQLNDQQESILLDILLRVIEADEVVMPAERELLRALRPVLHISDALLLGHHPRLLGYLMPDGGDQMLQRISG
jgi:tellurite resistance protein